MEKTIHSKRYKQLLTLLKKVRVDGGFLQEDIAKKLDMNQGTYSKLETGDRRVDLVELESICQAMNINLSDFVKEFENKR